MKIVHISDTHKLHDEIIVPECDVLIHSGDIGGRTNLKELKSFLNWFDKQPAAYKIFIAGNHDGVLSKDLTLDDNYHLSEVGKMMSKTEYEQGQELIQEYKNINYLLNTGVWIGGLHFWGSPYTPSFHRRNWWFNRDRGEEISKEWAKIPSDVHVLITHGPPYGIMDYVENKRMENDYDNHVGCGDLLGVIKKRLLNLKLNCFGHLHYSYGIMGQYVSNTRYVLFSNGSVVDEEYNIVGKNPLIINI